MSTGAVKLSAEEGAIAARRFADLFPRDAFRAWVVAGSVRRRLPEVGDIEHVIVPATAPGPAAGLFGDTTEVNQVWSRLDEFLAAGTLEKAIYPDGSTSCG